MRSGVCEQALSPDAAAVMRQAASAARRRGHAQVTPLHVASAMLSSSSASDGGVLRGACLRSRPAASHPLQCKALELCLNVALNRLATTTTAYAPPAVSWPHHHQQQQRQPPALSNALAAAFKRAQASQRRGGAGAAAEGSSNHSRVVEVEQLVVSILDDPSVSRVMRDAGFSSAEVKANVLLLAGDNNDKPAAAAAAISSSSPDHNSSNTTSTGGASPPPNPSATKLLDTTIIQSTKPDAVARRVLDRTAGGGGGRGAPWRGGGQPSMEARVSGEMHPVVLPHGGLALSLAGGDSEITYGSTDMVVAATPANVPSWIRGPVLSVPELTLGFSSSPPPAAAYSSSIYGGFPHYDHNLFDPRQQQLLLMNHRHENSGPIIMAQSSHDHPWPTSPTNPGGGGSSNSVSISSSGGAPPTAETAARRRRPRFTELTAENLKVLSDAIEARVPGHRALAPAVASAVLRRRSGVATASTRTATTTWLVFQGMDIDSKMAMARELARLVFGSYDHFATVVELTNNKPARSGGSSSGKRPRSSLPEEEEEELGYVMRRLHEAVRENPHRVFLIEPTDNNGCSEEEADINIIKSAIATGIVRGRDGDDVASLEDAIVVLSFSCEGTEPWWSRVITSPRRRLLKQPRHDIGSKELDDDGVTEKGPRLSLDLNACAVVDGEPEEGRSSSLDGISAEILDAVDGVFFFQC